MSTTKAEPTPGQVYRHERDGQRFRVRHVKPHDITLDPIDRPVQRADTRFVGEVFPLCWMRAEDLRPPAWTLVG